MIGKSLDLVSEIHELILLVEDLKEGDFLETVQLISINFVN